MALMRWESLYEPVSEARV